MKKNINLFIASALVLLLASCQEEYKAPESKTVSMSGRWWTELYFDGDQTGIPTEDGLIYAYADFGGYGESGRHGEADAGHLGEVGAFAAEEGLHGAVAVGFFVPPGVNVFRCFGHRWCLFSSLKLRK